MLLFGLGPLTATLQADDDSRLPACCRRAGAHHCAMSDAMIAQMVQPSESKDPAWTLPDHCPLYPQHWPATVNPQSALTSTPDALAFDTVLGQPAERAGSFAESQAGRRQRGRSPPQAESH